MTTSLRRPFLSVIVPTRDRAALLPSLLDMLARQTRVPDEVILADESADDSVAQAAAMWQEAHPALPVRVLRLTVGSLPRSRNAGVAASRGEVIFFLDDDVELPGDYVARLCDALDTPGRGYAGGGAALTARPDFVLAVRPRHWLRRLFMLNGHADGRFLRNGMNTLPLATAGVVPAEFVAGGVGIWRRGVFDEFRFDEQMNGYANYEDAEFSYRVSRKYPLFYDAETVVYHRDVQDKKRSRAARLRQARMLSRNYLYHAHKNLPRTPLTALLCAWTLLGMLVWEARRRLLTECRGLLQGTVAFLRAGGPE